MRNHPTNTMTRTDAHPASAAEAGFTLIELLVVVIIIGVLAAIAIPTFLSQRSNAHDADAKSRVRNAILALVSYYAANGRYPNGNATANGMNDSEPSLKWHGSASSNVPLEDVPPKSISIEGVNFGEGAASSVVFGTMSESGRCFYALMRPTGTTYLSNTACQDPYSYRNTITDASY